MWILREVRAKKSEKAWMASLGSIHAIVHAMSPLHSCNRLTADVSRARKMDNDRRTLQQK